MKNIFQKCVNCPAGTNNWAKYLAVSLLPTTLFFIGTVVIKFRATSPLMNAYIMFCQIINSPTILRQRSRVGYTHEQTTIFGVLISFLSVWNLDFLKMVYPAPKCHNVAGTVSGLHHSSLPPCPDHPHLRISHTPLSQLQTCGVAVEALPQVLHSLSKAVEHSKLTCRCLCYLPPLVLCQVLQCLFRHPNTYYLVGRYSRERVYNALLQWNSKILFKGALAICYFGHHCSVSVYSPPHPSVSILVSTFRDS